MLLNRLEFVLMNNPVRATLQHHFEARRLRRMGGTLDGGRALEIGCGRGVGAELILREFGAASVDAFDLDPGMVARARRRLARYGSRARAWGGDVMDIDAPKETYDAVFDFGIIHHVEDWRRALVEVSRVLKPGGRFFAEEVLRPAIVHPLVRRLLKHPQTDRFDATEFGEGLAAAGLTSVSRAELCRSLAWFVAVKEPGRPSSLA